MVTNTDNKPTDQGIRIKKQGFLIVATPAELLLLRF